MSKRARRMRAMLLAAAAAALACAAPANADHQPAGPPTTGGGLGPPAEPSPGPSIDGSPADGQTLTAELGTWAPGTDLTSEWLRCDTAGANCLLTHDTDGSYTLAPADVGSTIVLRVRGTDTTPIVGGFRDADSAATAEVDAISPQNTALPTFTGTERDGQILSGTAGSWTGTPTIGFTYQWQRCTSASPASCSDIVSGGTSIDYTLTPADVGNRVRLQETATRAENASDTTTASSDLSGVIDAIPPGSTPPTNTTAPSFTGTARDGQVLSGTPGIWTGTPTIGFTYQWQRCSPGCSNIAGATSSKYTLKPDDVGRRLRLVVIAAGPGGTSFATSPQSAIVTAKPVANSGSGGGGTTGTTTLRKLSPFPVVAIGGRVFRSGVRVSQLRISRAPTGSIVTVTCKGRSCPFKRARRRIRRRSGLRIKSLERAFRPGTVIVIIVGKGNTIGKYTRLRIRKRAAPARIDRCIRPGARRPSTCPG